MYVRALSPCRFARCGVRPSARQRRLRVTRCIIRLVFFFSFRFFRSVVHNIPIYITLFYYVYTCEYFVCTILYALVAVLHFARSPPTPRTTIYSIGIGKYAYIAIIYIILLCSRPGRCAVCVRVCLWCIIRAYGRKPSCAGETKQTPRGFQLEGKN